MGKPPTSHALSSLEGHGSARPRCATPAGPTLRAIEEAQEVRKRNVLDCSCSFGMMSSPKVELVRYRDATELLRCRHKSVSFLPASSVSTVTAKRLATGCVASGRLARAFRFSLRFAAREAVSMKPRLAIRGAVSPRLRRAVPTSASSAAAPTSEDLVRDVDRLTGQQKCHQGYQADAEPREDSSDL